MTRDGRLSRRRRPLHDDHQRLVQRSHLAATTNLSDALSVEAADKEDARTIMLALMSADAKLDKIIYLLTEDDEEEENGTDS